MGGIGKPDPALVAEFEAALEAFPGVTRRKMFGCPSAFVNGQLFAGVYQDRLLVRVPEAAPLHPFAPGGHPMREYAALPGALDFAGGEMQAWLRRAYDYACGLPPKVPSPRKRPARSVGASAKKKAASAGRKSPAAAKKTAATKTRGSDSRAVPAQRQSAVAAKNRAAKPAR
jgi:TfoX/Sxy family transcriptional regulator of competence genes